MSRRAPTCVAAVPAIPETCRLAVRGRHDPLPGEFDHSRVQKSIGQAGGPGVRSPAHARAPMGRHASIRSSMLLLAHPLCGQREWGLRPDTQTTCPAAGLARRGQPKRSSRWAVGFAGAGPICGCPHSALPDTVLMEQPRRAKGRHPRAWAGERKPRRPPARSRQAQAQAQVQVQVQVQVQGR